MAKSYSIGDSRVLESRESTDGKAIRRRRATPDGQRFTTYERIERRNIAVVKKDGSRELFDRDKLGNSIHRSVGKFFESEMEVEEAYLTVRAFCPDCSITHLFDVVEDLVFSEN